MINKDNTIFIRLTKEEKENLKKLAQIKGLSLSAFCRMLLKEKINE
jgi:predicted DNA binding CopG/RHH family protein